MKLEPVWNLKSSPLISKSLAADISVDVAIIGGGITGITTAHLLKDKGLKVVVLEARRVGEGTTGQSTGNLYALTEYPLQKLKKKYDAQTLKQLTAARMNAVEFISNHIRQHAIDCDFKMEPMFVFEDGGDINIEKELEIATEIGLPLQSLSAQNFPLAYDSGFVLQNQAQFNPLTYTQQLAKLTSDSQCEIYENTAVTEIEEKDDLIYLKTIDATVKAKYIVHATHTPKGLHVQYHTTLGPYREYGVAAKLKNERYPEGVFWGHFQNKKYSVRTYGAPENPYLIAVGCMHKVGQAGDNTQNIKELEDFLRQHFEVENVSFVWGGQNYKSADMLPYIGRKNKNSNQFIATGFSTDGLVYGTLAAQIISDTINSTENPYAHLFEAARHEPLKTAADFVKENLNVAARLVGDFFKSGENEHIKELQPEEGKLLQLEDGKYAVFKSATGEIRAFSPICPHMGCTVDWNKAEKTWDCPCHGSRFDTCGNVIEGPALKGLAPATDETKDR